MQNVKLEDLEMLPCETLNVEDVALFLGMDAQCIRSQAQTDPSKLGFPVIVVGRRIVVPRRAFIHFMRYGFALGSRLFV